MAEVLGISYSVDGERLKAKDLVRIFGEGVVNADGRTVNTAEVRDPLRELGIFECGRDKSRASKDSTQYFLLYIYIYKYIFNNT